MTVAIDISPLSGKRTLSHRVRGTGFYIENLKRALLEYYPENKYIFFTRTELLPENIDLVHYPYFEPFFLSLPIIKKYKTVVTVHDLTPLVFRKYFPVGIRGNIKWQAQKIALKKADAIITDSMSSKKDIVKHTGIDEDKIHAVYLAAGERFRKMEDGRWKMEIKEKYNLPENFVLYVGDVTWNKNLPRLIKAVQKINIPIIMVGKALVKKNFDKTNPWNQDLLTVQKLIENDKRVIRLGFVPQEDLVMLYNLATVFAMPSLYEGFGLPILEAMSCGIPVITSSHGSIPEVAGDAAYYVDAYNTEDISQGIRKVFDDTDLQKELAGKGNLWVKKFSWQKTAKKTIKVYESI